MTSVKAFKSGTPTRTLAIGIAAFRARFPRRFRNVVSNWAGSAISMALAFFLSPFVVHHLGNTAYGLWILIMSLTGYLGLFDLGVRGAVTYFIAKFHTQAKHKDSSRLTSSALIIFVFLGGAAIAASAAAALVFPKLFHIPLSHTQVGILLLLAGASVATTLVSSIFGAVIVGLQRFELSNTIEISVALSRSLAILLALSCGYGLIALAIIQLAFSLLTGMTYAFASRILYPELRVSAKLWNKEDAYRVLSFGGYLLLLNASAYLILYTDSLVVGAFLSVAMVAFFAIAGNLVNYARSLLSGVSTTLSPLASSLEAGGKNEKLDLMCLAVSRYAVLLILPIMVTLAIRGKTFIGLWMGRQYATQSGSVLQILCIALFCSAASQVCASMMIGLNKVRPIVFVNVIEGVTNLVLSIILVRILGLVGVAWGTAIPRLITAFVFWPLYLRHTLGIAPLTYAVSVWARPVIAALPFTLLSFIFEKTWYAPTIAVFFIQVLLALPLLLVTFWFVCLSCSERASLVGRVSAPFGGVGELA